MQKKPMEAIYYLTSGKGTISLLQISLVIAYYPFVMACENNALHKISGK